MAVIVHNSLFADTLYIKAGSGGAERAKAHCDAKDPIDLGPDRHEFWQPTVGWQAGRSRYFSDLRGTGAQADCKTTQEITSVHQTSRKTGLERFIVVSRLETL
jgi:hypothetical protein